MNPDSALKNAQCENAVLFLIFNRPDTTYMVFEAIREARPPRLYIACDGPRPGRDEESRIVAELREGIMARIDWPCDVEVLFRETNLGCKLAVSGALNWFFEKEEQGIILEDDCLPSPSFFKFCDALLAKHANDAHIAGITGDYRPVLNGHKSDGYGLVGYPLIWGWASWRRVWKLYDPTLRNWNGNAESMPALATKPRATREYLTNIFNRVKSGDLNTWDFQFNYLCLEHGMDFIHPYLNMITNIGFASGATHTSDPSDPNAALPRYDVRFPLQGPIEDRTYQQWLDRKVFADANLGSKVLKRLKRWSRGLKLDS